ncbi:hypothetical protein [Xanthomonas euvesicatoria]|uniref:hypothetical protein n=1 Tax=Xanthomonas euvesicatoria TaxID=456327 RepID=UPI002455F27B|nr:hypothetical protein [Xanthomonas euvesicatoria]
MELAAGSSNVEDKEMDYGMDNPHQSWLSATQGRRDQNFARTLRLDFQVQIIAPRTIPLADLQAAVISLHCWQNIGNAQLDLTPIQATS